MKRLFIFGFLLLALARLAVGQPAAQWVNNGTLNYTNPPNIDATNVINNGQLNIDLGSVIQGGAIVSAQPYVFSDALVFTNRGLMTCSSGFAFNNTPFDSGGPQRAASFGNANIGTISGSSNISFVISSGGTSFSIGEEGASLIISATNVVNNGLLQVTDNGLISVDGSIVDLKGGSLICTTSATVGTLFGQFFGSTTYGTGISDLYWGLDSQTNQIANGTYTLQGAASPPHTITNQFYQQIKPWEIFPQNAIGSANVVPVNASNLTTQIVIVGNTNPAITVTVHYSGGGGGFATPIVQWLSVATNSFGVTVTNTLYLSDAFGAITNFQFYTNDTGFQTGIPLLSPTNYIISPFDFFGFAGLPTGNFPYNAALVPAGKVTNQYAALGVTLAAETFSPDPNLPDQVVSNSPGRILVSADKYLNLARTIINGPNYVRLTSTNHFAGSGSAQITAPNMDISLGSTNGQMFITNLVVPFIPEFIGTVEAYSARWTNIDATGFTNSYHILMVDSSLATFSQPLVQNFLIGVTTSNNIVIPNTNNVITNFVLSDVLNIVSNLIINATSLTITSNGPGSQAGYGQINLQSPDLLWSSSLPTLSYVTNFGLIFTPNTAYFALSGTLPYYATNFTSNYQTFVNHGDVVSSGNTTWTSYFENTGAGTNLAIVNPATFSTTTNLALIYSTFGPISIIASNALMANGAFVTFPSGDITISADSVVISNHFLIANGALTLLVTNSITDDGASSNFWSVTDGMNMPIKPVMGDLRGTTITNSAVPGLEVDNEWAGHDLGAVPAGFTNNGAVGHLILDGGNTNEFQTYPQFHFFGPDASNAIYVDLLELRDGATNTMTENNSPFFSTFDIDPNFTIYFADAVLGPFDISEKLNGANGGRLVWVPSYAGIFSGTNLVYPGGVTNRFNRALVTSTDIDSNGNGIDNAFDSQPIYVAGNINLKIGFTNVPPRTPAITWYALADATNYLYYRTNLTSTNWLLVTNFVQPLPSANVTVLDRGRTNRTGFYKVQVDPILP